MLEFYFQPVYASQIELLVRWRLNVSWTVVQPTHLSAIYGRIPSLCLGDTFGVGPGRLSPAADPQLRRSFQAHARSFQAQTQVLGRRSLHYQTRDLLAWQEWYVGRDGGKYWAARLGGARRVWKGTGPGYRYLYPPCVRPQWVRHVKR